MKAAQARTWLEGHEFLIQHSQSRNPQGGRAAAAAAVARELGPTGRQRIAEAEQAVARQASKKARRAQEAAQIARSVITESMTSASTRQAAAASAPPPPLHEMSREAFGEYASEALAPLFRPSRPGASRAVAETMTASGAPQPPPGTGFAAGDGNAELAGGQPARPLHEMTLEELDDYASAAITDYGRSVALQSPFWQR